MERNTTSYSGNMPEYYDSCLGPLIFVDYAKDIARRAAALSPGRVLETAAGTGILSRCLRDHLPAASKLTCTDLSPAMLEVAKAKFRTSEQITFLSADATALPLPSGAFEMVVCQFGVMFYPDKDKSYREAYRVLVPGGRYLFSVWDSHRYNSFGRIAHETVGRFFPKDPPQFQKVPFSYAFEPIKDSLISAGFTDLRVDVVRFEKVVGDGSQLARGLIYGSPLIDQISARGGLEAERVIQALRTEYCRKLGNPGKIQLQAMVFSAKRPGD